MFHCLKKVIFYRHTWGSCYDLVPLVFRDITDDEACVDELRMTFRFFASVLVRRAQKVTIKHSSISQNRAVTGRDTFLRL